MDRDLHILLFIILFILFGIPSLLILFIGGLICWFLGLEIALITVIILAAIWFLLMWLHDFLLDKKHTHTHQMYQVKEDTDICESCGEYIGDTMIAYCKKCDDVK